MCKTIEETTAKLKALEVLLEGVKKDLEILKTSQCISCRQRMREKQYTPDQGLRY